MNGTLCDFGPAKLKISRANRGADGAQLLHSVLLDSMVLFRSARLLPRLFRPQAVARLAAARRLSTKPPPSEPAPPPPPPPADEPPAGAKDDDSDAGVRERLLEAALKEVPAHGWSVAALSAGAVTLGLSPTAHGVLPRGPIELVRHFSAQCDEALKKEIEARSEELGALETHNRLIIAIETRLALLQPHAATWPQALALRALPTNLLESLQDAQALSELLLTACGDAAATEVAPKLMDPHLKRASLAAVYGAAELYMLTDRSPGFTDTSCFVEREVAALQQAAGAATYLGGLNPASILASLLPRK